jgi:hypothetical protein
MSVRFVLLSEFYGSVGRDASEETGYLVILGCIADKTSG